MHRLLALMSALSLVCFVTTLDAQEGSHKKKEGSHRKPVQASAFKDLTLTGTVVEKVIERKNKKSGEMVTYKRYYLKDDETGRKWNLPKRRVPEGVDLADYVGKTVELKANAKVVTREKKNGEKYEMVYPKKILAISEKAAEATE